MKRNFTIITLLLLGFISLSKAQINVEFGEPVVSYGINQAGTLKLASPKSNKMMLKSTTGSTFNISYNDPDKWGIDEQRALNYAISIWENEIWDVNGVRIKVEFSNTLAGGLSSASVRYISGVGTRSNYYAWEPDPNVVYPSTLIKRMNPDWNSEWNSLFSQLGDGADVTLSFNIDKSLWYFGIDGNTPIGKYDFVTAVLREMAKGFGFVSTVVKSGATNITYMSMGKPTAFDIKVNSLTSYIPKSEGLKSFAQSGNVYFGYYSDEYKLYAPNPFENKVSLNYFDESAYGNSTKALMAPYLRPGEAIHWIGFCVKDVLHYVGWYDVPVHTCDDCNKRVYISSNNIEEPMNYNTNYSFSINASSNMLLMTRKCTFEILTKDGNNYELQSFPGLSIFPGSSFILNLPSISVIPDGYDWVRTVDGTLKARIHFEGVDINDSFHLYEDDYYVSIPYKPSTPRIEVNSTQDMGWASHVTLEFTAYGANSYYLTYETENRDFIIPFYITNNPNINGTNTYTIQYVDQDIENYFTIVARNQYGESASAVLTYGGESMLMSSSLNSSLEISTMNAYAYESNLSLTFETIAGNLIETSIKDVEIKNLSNPLIMAKVQNYQSGANINISSLPSGLYAIKAVDNKGNMYSAKFLKK